MDDGEKSLDEVIGHLGSVLLQLLVEVFDGLGFAAEVGDELGEHFVADAEVRFELGADLIDEG